MIPAYSPSGVRAGGSFQNPPCSSTKVTTLALSVIASLASLILLPPVPGVILAALFLSCHCFSNKTGEGSFSRFLSSPQGAFMNPTNFTPPRSIPPSWTDPVIRANQTAFPQPQIGRSSSLPGTHVSVGSGSIGTVPFTPGLGLRTTEAAQRAFPQPLTGRSDPLAGTHVEVGSCSIGTVPPNSRLNQQTTAAAQRAFPQPLTGRSDPLTGTHVGVGNGSIGTAPVDSRLGLGAFPQPIIGRSSSLAGTHVSVGSGSVGTASFTPRLDPRTTEAAQRAFPQPTTPNLPLSASRTQNPFPQPEVPERPTSGSQVQLGNRKR